jgi:hypothetical protein
MAELRPTVRVDVGDESDDLLETLSVRGFETRRVSAGEIEVAPPEGEEELWNLEIVAALEAWLETSGRTEVVARLGKHAYTVRVPEWRDAAEEAELEARPEPDEAPLHEETQAPERRFDPLLLAAGAGAIVLLAAGIWLLLAAVFQLV